MIHLQHDDDGARFHWVREFSMPWNTISFNISSAQSLKPHEITNLGFSQSSKINLKVCILALIFNLFKCQFNSN